MPTYTVHLVPSTPPRCGPLSVFVQADSLADALVAAHRLHPGANLFAAEAQGGPYAPHMGRSADGTSFVLRTDHVCLSVDNVSVCINREFDGVTVDTFPEGHEGENALTRARLTHSKERGRLLDEVEEEFAQTPTELAEFLWTRIDLRCHFRDLDVAAWTTTRAAGSTILKRHVRAVHHGDPVRLREQGDTVRRLDFVVWVNDAGRPLREAYLVDTRTGDRLLGVESDFQREDAHSLAERAYRNFNFAESHGDVEGDAVFEVYTNGADTILTKPVFIRPCQLGDNTEASLQRVAFEVHVYRGLVKRIAATGSKG